VWYSPQDVKPIPLPCLKSRHARLLVEFVQSWQLQMKSIAGAGTEAATPRQKNSAAAQESFRIILPPSSDERSFAPAHISIRLILGGRNRAGQPRQPPQTLQPELMPVGHVVGADAIAQCAEPAELALLGQYVASTFYSPE
jgi:hypothetical protein